MKITFLIWVNLTVWLFFIICSFSQGKWGWFSFSILWLFAAIIETLNSYKRRNDKTISPFIYIDETTATCPKDCNT